MTKHNSYTRRQLVRLGVQLPAIGAAGSVLIACGAKQSAPLCANPDDWSMSEGGLRKANNYTELSEDPEKNCRNCAFFKAEADSSCGQCDIFTGAAHADGYCDSWSAKV